MPDDKSGRPQGRPKSDPFHALLQGLVSGRKASSAPEAGAPAAKRTPPATAKTAHRAAPAAKVSPSGGLRPGAKTPSAAAKASPFAHLRTAATERAAVAAADERSRARAARSAAPATPEPTFAEKVEAAGRKLRGEHTEPKPGTFGARVAAAMKKLGRD